VGALVALDSPTVSQVLQDGFDAAERARVDGVGASTLEWLHDTDGDAGMRVVVYRMAFGNARLCIGPASWMVYDAGYCYDGVALAVFSAATWIVGGMAGEPERWKKNLQTGEWKESA
jgi:hypothetical protein